MSRFEQIISAIYEATYSTNCVILNFDRAQKFGMRDL